MMRMILIDCGSRRGCLHSVDVWLAVLPVPRENVNSRGTSYSRYLFDESALFGQNDRHGCQIHPHPHRHRVGLRQQISLKITLGIQYTISLSFNFPPWSHFHTPYLVFSMDTCTLHTKPAASPKLYYLPNTIRTQLASKGSLWPRVQRMPVF